MLDIVPFWKIKSGYLHSFDVKRYKEIPESKKLDLSRTWFNNSSTPMFDVMYIIEYACLTTAPAKWVNSEMGFSHWVAYSKDGIVNVPWHGIRRYRLADGYDAFSEHADFNLPKAVADNNVALRDDNNVNK